MAKVFKTFQIHAGTFDFGINFCITKDLERACKWINFKLELPTSKELAIDKDDLDCLGKRIYIYGYCPIVWLPNIPTTPNELGTCYHEIFHAVCDCMRWANIPLSPTSEEAYCHLIKHITKQFFIKTGKK